MTTTATLATASDARDLRRDLAKSQRRKKLVAAALIAPLALFLAFAFLAPLAEMLRRAVIDEELAAAWPRTAAAMQSFSGGVPDEAVFAGLAEDLREARERQTLGGVARRLNYALPDGRGLVMNTARSLSRLSAPPPSWREAFMAANPAWGEPATWAAIRHAAGPVTDFYLLAAVDQRRDAAGSIVGAPVEQRLYLDVFARTFGIAASVTLICVVLGFPLAWVIANAPPAVARILLVLVLLPFWTSLLVRTTAWIVLLQEQGLVNAALMRLGLVEAPMRLVFNRTGVLVAMVHVLLPFMVLPLYATLAGIPPSLMRAAKSLGAPPLTAFFRVYLPQTVPGLAAGSLLVFILALGYYITPALVGGAEDQMVAYFIAFYTTATVNWGLAAALGAVLLLATTVLYLVYSRLVGQTKMSL
jgi:putative spermidine/putrescine transport system permease protein